MRFAEFFQRATEGLSAFAYQQVIAEREDLPWVLNAPTGAGKTVAAVLGWVWRRRLHPNTEVRDSTPRRLVYCLPMRVLVEQTVDAVRNWLANLDLLTDLPGDEGKIGVYQLMGGEVENDWDAYPEADAIVVGTQDQLLSRALNRGYTLSRYRWPMHFGLLNSDCLWVMDEVQLMGPGLTTTLQLQALRRILGTCGPVQSIWMSATVRFSDLPTVDGPAAKEFLEHALAISPEDQKHPELAKRLQAPKPLLPSDVSLTKDNAKSYAAELAEEVLREHATGSLTLVVLNQVSRAQAVMSELNKLVDDSLVERVLLHSRFRPAERRVLQASLSADVPPQGRIVVATQAVEAGVDISARVLFTELAPWPSLVQRFGRCNRRGEWAKSECEVRWIDIADERDSFPYEAEGLTVARELLQGLDDVGLTTLEDIPDPTTAEPTQVLRRRDLLELFDTTPDLAGNDIDVSPYIRDADDLDVSVLWRDLEDQDAVAVAPSPEELCPVRLPALVQFFDKAQERGAERLVWDGLSRRWERVQRNSLRPGLIVLLDAKAGGYDTRLGWWPQATETQPVVAAVSDQSAIPVEGYDDDHLTATGRFVSLAEHLADVMLEVKKLQDLGPAGDGLKDVLLESACWHDLGKAHPYFQDLLLAGLPEDDARRESGPWAKSDHWGAADQKESARPHFRHELASALAMLQQGASDLAAYLVASHHGKVRLSIRSLPGERQPDGGERFARGIWEGDVLPAVVLGDKREVPTTVLSLELMEMGGVGEESSWLERTLELLDRYGPFQLAYLEALLRVADWRASAKEGDADG